MIGKWNKSVILTYVGLSLAVLGVMLILLKVDLKYAIICLMASGVCDLFDGTVARRCKRTKEEEEFGIELDSLVDVFSFIALPLVILASINTTWYYLPIAIIYAIFAIARLAYFNIKTADSNKAISSYIGLPVTYAALIFPIIYLLSYLIKNNIFIIIYNVITLIVSILFILKIKVPKPKLVSSIILLLTFLIVTIIYLFVV
jgi:CDP-diacylglycerol--serine O-phosphatidyltransferase